MTELKLKTLPPSSFSGDEIAQFIALVQQGGEVADGVQARIRRAKALVMILLEEEVQAVAALKVPLLRYRDDVFKKSKKPDLAPGATYEVGWIFVSPQHRRLGLSSKLVDAAISLTDGASVFATTRTDNEPMQRVLSKAGFSKCGSPYPSNQNPGSDLQLFLRSAG